MIEQSQKPRLKVMCLFVHNGKVLASKGHDIIKDEYFYRVLGGSLEVGEKMEEGIRREVKEELGCEIENLNFIKIIENIFTYEGNIGHDVVFLYKGDLANKELYNKEKIRIVEPYGEFDAEWLPVEDVLNKKAILYPATDYSALLE